MNTSDNPHHPCSYDRFSAVLHYLRTCGVPRTYKHSATPHKEFDTTVYLHTKSSCAGNVSAIPSASVRCFGRRSLLASKHRSPPSTYMSSRRCQINPRGRPTGYTFVSPSICILRLSAHREMGHFGSLLTVRTCTL